MHLQFDICVSIVNFKLRGEGRKVLWIENKTVGKSYEAIDDYRLWIIVICNKPCG
jgi:hypothetical protein